MSPSNSSLSVQADVIKNMKLDAERDRPRETCALLSGDGEEISHYHPMSNLNEGLDELLQIEGMDSERFESISKQLSLHNDQENLINVNEASAKELGKIDGINQDLSEAIVDRRRRVGKYEDPRIHFKFDPDEQLKAHREAREQGLDVIGVYHSHPHHDSEAYPSEEDQRMGHAGYIYFILNFQPDETIIRAFEMNEDEVTEISYEVVES